MRVALLGAGRIGQLHARILAQSEGVSGLLVADPAADRAAAIAATLPATTATTPEEALAGAHAAVIAAPTNAHPALIRAAIEHGLPTFCEKPLADDLPPTIELVGQIEASGVPFQLGFQRRFDPGYREARRLIAGGELGTVYALRMAGHDPAPPPEAYIPTSGGLFRDFSIHDFDMLRWLTGSEVEEVYADGGIRGFPVFARYGDVDTAVATLRLSGGELAVLTVARHDPRGYDVRAEVFGSRDSISVGLGPRMPLRSVEPGVPPPGGPEWTDFLVRFEPAYRAELAAFVQVARGEVPPPCTARDGLEALRVAEAATLSLREQRVVRLSEIPNQPRLKAGGTA